MTVFYTLAPNGRWSARNLVGDAAVDGTVETYAAGTLSPKITWEDPHGITPNGVIVELDAAGEASIYWGFDPEAAELYYIRIRDKNGNLVYEQDDYPTMGVTTGQPPIPAEIGNYVRNAQFTWWTRTNSFPATLQSSNDFDYYADEWLFSRSNTTATVNISQQLFPLGQTTVPGNPLSYFHYDCGDATSAGETYKHIAQKYGSVQTLANQTISCAFWARSTTGSTLTLNITQSFGTGGTPSPTATTTAIVANLNSSWRRYKATLQLPNVTGMTLGTNGDDYLAYELALPLNTLATSIDICNCQLQPTDNITDFVNESEEQQFMHLQNLIAQSLFTTGDVKFSLRSASNNNQGWLLCTNSTAIGNGASGSTYAGVYCQALFTLIWNNVSNTYAVIYNSDGSPGTRGSTAQADFAANKRLQITTSGAFVIANAAGSIPLGTTAGATTASFSGTTSTSVTFNFNITEAQLPVVTAAVTFPVPVTNPPGSGDSGINTHVAAGAGSGFDWDTSGGGDNRGLYQQGHVTFGSGTAVALGPTAFAGTCSGTGISTLQPTIYYNLFIKL